MKPRVLIVASKRYGATYRLVRRGGPYVTETVVEKADGQDSLNRTRWRIVLGESLKAECENLIDALGRTLVKRENAARKARRARGGKR